MLPYPVDLGRSTIILNHDEEDMHGAHYGLLKILLFKIFIKILLIDLMGVFCLNIVLINHKEITEEF